MQEKASGVVKELRSWIDHSPRNASQSTLASRVEREDAHRSSSIDGTGGAFVPEGESKDATLPSLGRASEKISLCDSRGMADQ